MFALIENDPNHAIILYGVFMVNNMVRSTIPQNVDMGFLGIFITLVILWLDTVRICNSLNFWSGFGINKIPSKYN